MYILLNTLILFTVPSAKLLGPMEVFLDNGSALNLTCVILHTPVPPEFVHWYHRGQVS